MGRKNKCKYRGMIFETEREALDHIWWTELNGCWGKFSNYKAIKRAYLYEKQCTDEDRANKEYVKYLREHKKKVWNIFNKEERKIKELFYEALLYGEDEDTYKVSEEDKKFLDKLITEARKEFYNVFGDLLKYIDEEIKNSPYNTRANTLYGYTKGKIELIEEK